MAETDRIAALELRASELEAEVAALTAVVLMLGRAPEAASEGAEWRAVFSRVQARWPELPAGEVRRLALEIMAPSRSLDRP